MTGCTKLPAMPSSPAPSSVTAPRRSPWWRTVRLAALALLLVWVATSVFHRYKPLPEGLSVAMPERPAIGLRFLADLAWVDDQGDRVVDQAIFDRILAMIGRAERLIVMDMFLFNDFAGDASGNGMRRLSDEVEQALVQRRRQVPALRAVVITDPINRLYGGLESERLDRLRAAGVEVVVTRLDRLRDSNPAWSGFWRLCCRWAGNSADGGWLPNPVGEGRVSLRTWLALVNFKANHRKTLVVDSPNGWTALITSGNPHDGSSAHGNVALEFGGPAALDLLQTEYAVVEFSTEDPVLLADPEPDRDASANERDVARIQVLTEAAIRDASIAAIDRTEAGDRVDLAMFYLAHRGMIRALKRAVSRGVVVRALIDPNRDAFGKQKNGIPNRPVAHELVDAGVAVRWCRTTGEQCHSKFLRVDHAGGSELIAGSANYTRRNLDDLNLETSLRVRGPPDTEAMMNARDWFEQRWTNRSGRQFSLPYEAFADDSLLRYWRYRLMEASGLSTF